MKIETKKIKTSKYTVKYREKFKKNISERRRFLKGPNLCTKFDSLNYLFKRRASYYFKAWEFINLQAFEFFNYGQNCILNHT